MIKHLNSSAFHPSVSSSSPLEVPSIYKYTVVPVKLHRLVCAFVEGHQEDLILELEREMGGSSSSPLSLESNVC